MKGKVRERADPMCFGFPNLSSCCQRISVVVPSRNRFSYPFVTLEIRGEAVQEVPLVQVRPKGRRVPPRIGIGYEASDGLPPCIRVPASPSHSSSDVF